MEHGFRIVESTEAKLKDRRNILIGLSRRVWSGGDLGDEGEQPGKLRHGFRGLAGPQIVVTRQPVKAGGGRTQGHGASEGRTGARMVAYGVIRRRETNPVSRDGSIQLRG